MPAAPRSRPAEHYGTYAEHWWGHCQTGCTDAPAARAPRPAHARPGRARHPGVLDAKVGHCGVKSTKVHRSGYRWAQNLLKSVALAYLISYTIT